VRAVKTLLLLFTFLISIPAAQAVTANRECRRNPVAALKTLQSGQDPDARSKAGICLVQSQLDRQEVAKAVLRIMRDSSEDLLLREDLIAAFGESTLRRQIQVDGNLSPELGAQDKAAVERTLASAHGLLAVTRAVKSMQETVPVCALESDFFHALSEIAMDDSSHVLLRASAVEAMEKASKRVAESGVYDEKQLRLVQETLKVVASREDNASYYSGAALAYNRLADSSLPGFPPVVAPANTTRVLSSVKSIPAK
jgi:hypothetical protein